MKSKWPTKKQWLEIAEAFNISIKKRTERQKKLTICRGGWCDCGARLGICHSLDRIKCKGLANNIRIFCGNTAGAFWYDCNDEGDQERTFFCCMMAAITEKDFREMESQP